MNGRFLWVLSILLLGFSSCALVDKEAIIGTWVCEDFEYEEVSRSQGLSDGALSKAKKKALAQVFTFHNDIECTVNSENKTLYGIDVEYEILHIFDKRYPGMRNKSDSYDILSLSGEKMILKQPIKGLNNVILTFYKED